jgi:hypothetical protein
MSTRLHPELLLASLLCAAGVSAVSLAQSSPNPPGPCAGTSQSEACSKSASDKKSPAEKFPFPGQAAVQPGASPSEPPAVPKAPDSSAPGVAPNSTEKQFPFPGEPGTSPAAPAPTTGSSSSSSAEGNSSPADSASEPDLKDKGSEGQQQQSGRHLLHRVNPPGTKLQSPEERAAEDLDVAHFYMDSGDFRAAYLRGQDAVRLEPDNAAAHLVLAEVAVKLNKPDEAITHYEACLKLDPTDKEAKAARKALTRLQAQR